MRLIEGRDWCEMAAHCEFAGSINDLDGRHIVIDLVGACRKRQADPRHCGEHGEHDVAETTAEGEGCDEDQRQDAKADGQRAGEGMGEGMGHAPLPGPFRRPSFTPRAKVAGEPVGAGELQRLRGCGAVDLVGASHGRIIAEQAENVDRQMRSAPVKRLAVAACLAALISTPALAQSPRQQAQEAAGAATGATSVVKGGQQQLVDRVPGFQTGDPTNLTRHYDQEGAGLEDATFQKLGNANDGEGGEAASTMIETYTTRPNINVTRTDEFLATSRGVLGNPDLLAGDLFATNQNPACQATQVNSTPFEIKGCDKYGAPEEATCGLGVEVDVLAEKTYACFTETPTYRKTCAETLTARCTEILSNCRLEDGLITTPAADLQLSYVNFRHRAFLPNREVSGCGGITRRMYVNITDIDKLATARLSRVDYHDGLSVFVNDAFVWGGPFGDGGRRNLYGVWTTGGADINGNPIALEGIGDPASTSPGEPGGGFDQYLGSCFRDSNIVTTPGVDIKPFMIEGRNEIRFELTVGSLGGFTADFQILMSCCGNWEETWERTCPE